MIFSDFGVARMWPPCTPATVKILQMDIRLSGSSQENPSTCHLVFESKSRHLRNRSSGTGIANAMGMRLVRLKHRSCMAYLSSDELHE